MAFVDIYEKGLKTEEEEAVNVIPPKPVMPPNEIVREHSIETTFSDDYNAELVKMKIVEEVRAELRETLTEQIRKDLREEIHNELSRKLTKQIKEDLNIGIVESNKLLIETISALSDKVDALSESLSVEVPAPIVNVTIPSGNKTVLRDSNGRITGIADEE